MALLQPKPSRLISARGIPFSQPLCHNPQTLCGPQLQNNIALSREDV
jgi:hypothetical protein